VLKMNDKEILICSLILSLTFSLLVTLLAIGFWLYTVPLIEYIVIGILSFLITFCLFELVLLIIFFTNGDKNV
jgi:hypothetical protein